MVYIKVNQDNTVVIGGTEITASMKAQGYKGYNKSIPNVPFLKWDPKAKALIEDVGASTSILNEVKTSKIAELQAGFTADVKAISDASSHEMVSWTEQKAEALAYKASKTAPTPFIDAQLIARNLGETKLALVNKILANANAYSVAYATLLGKFQSLTAAVNTATTEQDIRAVLWTKPTTGAI